MAITRYSSFDKTVNTIAERNSIINKVNHMTVVVKDAIADPSAGAGKAIYRWDAVDNVWILVSKSTYETISFITEEITIANGKVQLANFPVDNNVWNAVILNGTTILGDLNVGLVSVSNSKITGINPDFNGYTLRVTYAYGSIAVQITSAIEDKIDATLLNSFNTINGSSVLGSGDIVTTQTTITGNAGTATKLQTAITINGVAFDGTSNITITDNTKLTKTNPSITGSVTEQVYNLTGTEINPANGTIQYKTVSSDTTFTETLTTGQSVLLRLINASSYTITFPTITWVGAAAPILTANCVIVLWKEQSALYGAFVGTLV